MRDCDHCGTSYQPIRSTSKYCRTACRVAAGAARKASRTTANLAVIVNDAPTAPLTDAIRAELGPLADTADGILLLTLAARIDAVPETSPALATLSKEFAARKADTLAHVSRASTPFDELQELRERRRA